MRAPLCAVCLAACCALGGRAAADAGADFPHARATVDRLLAEDGDPTLLAQRRYFPARHQALIDRLLEHERGGRSARTRLAILAQTQENWMHYNDLLRHGAPEHWRALLRMRRDLFALIARHDGAPLCRRYEYHGVAPLAESGRAAYRKPVADFLFAFVRAAAAARDRPQLHPTELPEDFAPLYQAMHEAGLDPKPPSARLIDERLDPQFCQAMVQMLDAVLRLDAPTGAPLWRLLVTVPADTSWLAEPGGGAFWDETPAAAPTAEERSPD